MTSFSLVIALSRYSTDPAALSAPCARLPPIAPAIASTAPATAPIVPKPANNCAPCTANAWSALPPIWSCVARSAIWYDALRIAGERLLLTAADVLVICVFSFLMPESAFLAPRSILSNDSSAWRCAIRSWPVFASTVYSIVPKFVVMLLPSALCGYLRLFFTLIIPPWNSLLPLQWLRVQVCFNQSQKTSFNRINGL